MLPRSESSLSQQAAILNGAFHPAVRSAVDPLGPSLTVQQLEKRRLIDRSPRGKTAHGATHSLRRLFSRTPPVHTVDLEGRRRIESRRNDWVLSPRSGSPSLMRPV